MSETSNRRNRRQELSTEVEATVTEEPTEAPEPEATPEVEPEQVEETEETEETTTEVVKLLNPGAQQRLVNQWLADKGIEKVLPQQMFYNYTTALVKDGKPGRIPTVESEGKVFVKEQALREWFELKYIPKNHPEKSAVTEKVETEVAAEAEIADATA